jgi:hypothetical protein
MKFIKGCERLQKLDCFNEVLERIDLGHNAMRIAEFIQEERKEYTDVTKESLRRIISKFIAKSGVRYIKSQAPSSHVNLRNSIPEFIDPAEMYQVLIAIQTERMVMAHQKEIEEGRVGEQGNKQVDLMNRILKSLADVDIDRRKIKEMVGSRSREFLIDSMDMIKAQYVERWGERTANIMFQPESRRRVLNALEQVRAGASGPLAKLLEKQRDQFVEQKETLERIEDAVKEGKPVTAAFVEGDLSD